MTISVTRAVTVCPALLYHWGQSQDAPETIAFQPASQTLKSLNMAGKSGIYSAVYGILEK